MSKPISVQLYSLREESKVDFPGVLKRVAAMGYKGVEPANFYGLSAKEVRKIVNDLGMVISSTHCPWAKADNAQEVIEKAGELGTTMVAAGWGKAEFADEAAVRRTADLAASISEVLVKAGLTVTVHNHWWEFERLPDGRLKHELFAELCPKVQFELDIYWAANFGANNTAEMVRKFAKRSPLLHIKDGSFVRDAKLMAVGTGKNDIAGGIAAADAKVLKWLVVEADTFDGNMFDCIQQSYTYLTSKGLALGNK